MWRLFEKGCDWLNKGCKWAGVALLFSISLMMCFHVLVRYILKAPTIWSMPLSVVALVFLFCLGMAYTQTQEGHVRVDILLEIVSPKTRNTLELINSLLSLVFIAIVIWCSTALVRRSLVTGQRTGDLMGIPTWVSQLALPIGGLIFFAYMIVVTVNYGRALRR